MLRKAGRALQNVIQNSKGTVFYGMHFYPGVAEYSPPDREPYRVYLNERTIRSMDPSFAGRPIYVDHVDDVNQNLDELRGEVDGWVIESFYNAADGKHWAKFLVTSERGLRAIKNGMRLSNAYVPQKEVGGGLWNGVEYSREITQGEYEHLAIVRTPRYEESVIMTPEEFKRYNEEHLGELKRLANSNDNHKETPVMKFFKRTKVENSVDFEGISTVLPKSGLEKTITQLINEADEMAEKAKKNEVDMTGTITLPDGTVCTIAEMVEKFKAMAEQIAELTKPQSGEGELVNAEEKAAKDAEAKKNADDAEAKKQALKLEEEKQKEVEAEKKKNGLDQFNKLKNAASHAVEEMTRIDLAEDKIARGKSRYGSN